MGCMRDYIHSSIYKRSHKSHWSFKHVLWPFLGVVLRDFKRLSHAYSSFLFAKESFDVNDTKHQKVVFSGALRLPSCLRAAFTMQKS